MPYNFAADSFHTETL